MAQDGEFSVEILVHDDASVDDSADRVARDYPNVRLIRSEKNVGFCVANNRMVEDAGGAYVLLLNNDAELQADALRAFLDEARELETPAILSLPQYDYSTGALIDRGCLLDPFFNPVPNLDPQRREVAMVIGACLWVPKKLWVDLGGFPDWFGSIAEDMYLCCRARLAGYPVLVLRNSGYKHHAGKSFGGGKAVSGRLATTYRRRALSERNKSFVMIACCPAIILWLLLPLHSVLLLLEGAVLSLVNLKLKPLKEIYVAALAACWYERHRLLKLHREVRATRRHGTRVFFSAFSYLPHKLTMLFRHRLPKII